MATYKEIQHYIKQKYSFTVKSCWIAHAKELCALPIRISHQRLDPNKRANPCPEKKFASIKDTFKHFDMI